MEQTSINEVEEEEKSDLEDDVNEIDTTIDMAVTEDRFKSNFKYFFVTEEILLKYGSCLSNTSFNLSECLPHLKHFLLQFLSLSTNCHDKYFCACSAPNFECDRSYCVFYQAIVDNLEKYDFLKIIQNFSTKCFGVFCHSCRRIYIQPDILTSLKFYKTIVDNYLGRIKHYLMINKKNLNINRNIFQDYSKDNPYTHIERSTIVGMTTTCASRYHSIIKDIAPSVLIVEEAAMVFESHVVALLNKNIQHLLLIGDHKQLKALSKNSRVLCGLQNRQIVVRTFDQQ